VVGRGAFIDAGVVVGDRCKIQNDALVYAPARLADGVFIGPAVVLTNDQYPRAISVEGDLKQASDWDPVGVELGYGASVGARAVCVAPVVIGNWALVAAGAVVVDDVPAHGLVVGVRARRIGWVGRSGHRLESSGEETFVCPVTGETYREVSGELYRDA
jgi:UDP-2-acetamido-3-amino-2,3-dideoxy-glucuronate N-acetyltransferase